MSSAETVFGEQSAVQERLEDPMRDISKRMTKILWVMFAGLIFLSLVLAILSFSTEDALGRTIMSTTVYFCWILFGAYFGNLVWWRAFAPRQDTDVFYLRSFQNDPASWPIRAAIQDALGDRVRLSGIRDPRRRVAPWVDGLSPWLKAMRHCTPKYMDLEAEDDWKPRLWNSLQSGSMAIIDLTEVTPFVLEEIALVTQAIGTERVVFIGTAPQQNEHQLREIIAQRIHINHLADLHVIICPNSLATDIDKNWLREFKLNIRNFYQGTTKIPPIVKQPVPETYVVPTTLPRQSVPMSRQMIKWMIGFQAMLVGFQVLLWLIAWTVTKDVSTQTMIVWLGSIPAIAVNIGFFVWNFVVYVRDVGITRRRIKACLLIALQVLAILPLFKDYIFPAPTRDLRPALSASEVAADQELLRRELSSNQR